MAYGKGSRLSFEGASKLGHLSVVQDPFVKTMVETFHKIKRDDDDEQSLSTNECKPDGDPLDFVIAVDGSLSTVPNNLAPHKTLSYIKIASLNISLNELDKANAPLVNPEIVQDILSKHADTQSTVLPLSNVCVPDKSLFQSIRHAINTTFEHFNNGLLYDTLRYLVSHEWDANSEAWKDDSPHRPYFYCPFCESKMLLPRSTMAFPCSHCKCDLTLADYLGLMMDVNEASNDTAIASNFMGVLEHLTALTYLRILIEKGHRYHSKVLILKDGPLMLRGQYSRLVDPIRGFLHHLNSSDKQFYLAGVEKSGAFVEHIEAIKGNFGPPGTAFVPNCDYILKRIKHSGAANTRYGEKVLYGAKVFYRFDDRTFAVLNIPHSDNSFCTYNHNPSFNGLIGLKETVSTLIKLVSRQYENALVPIEAVNRIASMSFYPSNNILNRFTDAHLGTT